MLKYMPTELEQLQQNYERLRDRSGPNGELIWQYTTWDAVEGILRRDNAIRLTHFAYLSDTSELRHFLRRAREVLDKDLFPRCHHYLGLYVDEEMDLSPVYVACFSKAFDSLSQWRAYCGSSIGVALGFNRSNLQQIAKSRRFSLEDCVYGIGGADALLAEMTARRKGLLETARRDESNPSLSAAEFGARVGPMNSEHGDFNQLLKECPRFKNESFSPEEEVRLVKLAHGTPVVVKFRRKGELLVPYIELMLRELSAGEINRIGRPLEGVLLAPGHSKLTRKALSQFLEGCGFHDRSILAESIHPERRPPS
jgi:hypothetical protein